MKIPKIERLPSGNYFCRLRLGGESIPITAESETECERLAYLKKSEWLAGKTRIQKTPKKTTLRDAELKYIEKYKKTLSPSTADRYEVYARVRFKEYLDKPLGEIKWQQMIDDELKLVSEKTVRNGWGLVRPSLKLVGFPTPDVKLAAVPVNETAFLQPDEIKKFCETVKGRPYEIPALLMLHGLRLSEMKALMWEDIKDNVIHVHGAYVKGSDGYVDKKTNKNRTSTRHVPIMIPQLSKALKAEKNKKGRVVQTHPSVLLRDIKRACRIAGVTEVSNHGLRHSFASLCFHLNIPMKQIQEWGGWKNDATLKRIYIHLAAITESKNREAFSGFFN